MLLSLYSKEDRNIELFFEVEKFDSAPSRILDAPVALSPTEHITSYYTFFRNILFRITIGSLVNVNVAI